MRCVVGGRPLSRWRPPFESGIRVSHFPTVPLNENVAAVGVGVGDGDVVADPWSRTLSFVPDVTQRLWRTVTRRKYHLTRNRVQLQNRLESLLEEAHIKVSSLVSDLLGSSTRRMLQALADGETDAETLAGLASRRLHARPDQLCDALGACTNLHPVYRRLLKLTLDELRQIEDHIAQLDHEMAGLLSQHQ